jgi:hypothetical protein
LEVVRGRGLPKVMLCAQNRELPEWGLLLDHCSHDLDIISSLSRQRARLKIVKAKHIIELDAETWEIVCEAGDETVLIKEQVGPRFYYRKASIVYDNGKVIQIDPAPVMFYNMWKAFLGGDYYPNIMESLETQILLQEAMDYAGNV